MRYLFIFLFSTFFLSAQAQQKHWACVTMLYDPELTMEAGVETEIGFAFEDQKGRLQLTQGYAAGKVSWDKLQVRVKNASFYRGKLTLKSSLVRDTITIRVNWLKYPGEVHTFYIAPQKFGHINLYYKGVNGKAGKSFREDGLRFSNGGEDGQNGEDGLDGENGKEVRATIRMKDTLLQVIVLSDNKNDTLYLHPSVDQLTLHSNGGDGGRGGDAGNGTPGKERTTSIDLNGGNGGKGGNGGMGGDGGNGGKITFVFSDEASWKYKDNFHGESQPGDGGKGGVGGRGGMGGNGGVQGRKGSDGVDGTNGHSGINGQPGPAAEYIKAF